MCLVYEMVAKPRCERMIKKVCFLKYILDLKVLSMLINAIKRSNFIFHSTSAHRILSYHLLYVSWPPFCLDDNGIIKYQGLCDSTTHVLGVPKIVSKFLGLILEMQKLRLLTKCLLIIFIWLQKKGSKNL